MARIKDVIVYTCAKYPHKSELSKARVTKLIYLADWKSAQTRGRQLTSIEWYFNNYGPYVDVVVDEARKDPRVDIRYTSTMYGDPKSLFSIKEDIDVESILDAYDKNIIDEVISETETLYWDAFIKHVYDTYPIRVTNRHKELNLTSLAKKEKLQLL